MTYQNKKKMTGCGVMNEEKGILWANKNVSDTVDVLCNTAILVIRMETSIF